MRRHFRIVLLVLLPAGLAGFTSCNFQGPHIPVLAGNYAYGRGDYQEATVQYLEALERDEYQPWVKYNLANVYHSLGEFDAAFELWEESLATDDLELLFAVKFNQGILYYEQGKYEEAFDSFKAALSYDPKHVGTKYNLELTLLKLQGAKGSGSQFRSQPASDQQGELSADSIRMFEYIRRKEEQLWIQQHQDRQLPEIKDW